MRGSFQSDAPRSTLRVPAPETRRKQEGPFYTPAFITRYIVEQTLGGVLQQHFEALRQRHHTETAVLAREAAVFDLREREHLHFREISRRLALRGPGQACTLYARACRRRGCPYTPCLSELLARQAWANLRPPPPYPPLPLHLAPSALSPVGAT